MGEAVKKSDWYSVLRVHKAKEKESVVCGVKKVVRRSEKWSRVTCKFCLRYRGNR